ncbi:MAG: isoprenylcysteine carboxylmethyltransferase family protein [Terracidiphilus sp.]
MPHLGAQVALRFAVMTPLIAAILFLPAWTVRWWQAWVFLAIYIGFALAAFFFFLKTVPQLVERRLPAREQYREQRHILRSGAVLLTAIFTLPGFDHRFSWSRRLWGAEPAWLAALSLVFMLAAELGMAWVLWTNRYAGRTIRVEEGQTVITSGPYRLVRHPMYAFSFLTFIFALLALGSYVALPALLLFMPIYVLRILNEEKVLRAKLAGYTEYCEKTRWRIMPGVW